jgi:hypothetical protein
MGAPPSSAKHVLEPIGDVELAGHRLHIEVPGAFENVPIGHETHWIAPIVGENWPGAHGRHAVAAAVAEKNPG